MVSDIAQVHFERGRLFYNCGDYDIAILELSETVRLNSNYAEAYVYRASAYNNKDKDSEQGIIDAERAMRLNPQLALAYFSRGEWYNNKENYDRAVTDLD
jgi:tetratricopeptide (TPR) repeat protein